MRGASPGSVTRHSRSGSAPTAHTSTPRARAVAMAASCSAGDPISRSSTTLRRPASAAVAELVLLAAPAVAGVVAAGGLFDPDGRLGRLGVVSDLLGVDQTTGGRFRRSGRPQRLRALDGALGGRVLEPAGGLLGRGLLLPDLGGGDVADEVVLHGAHHGLEHVEALPLPLDQRVLLAHGPEVDALLEVVHLVEVLAPLLVDDGQHDPALDLPEVLRPDRGLFLLVLGQGL